MKANEFVKKFGWEVAAIDLRNHEKYGTRSILYIYDDLKRLVESHDIVEKLGGINKAKDYVPDGYRSERLKQAIADVESCK